MRQPFGIKILNGCRGVTPPGVPAAGCGGRA
jgi:hypothetical protein